MSTLPENIHTLPLTVEIGIPWQLGALKDQKNKRNV